MNPQLEQQLSRRTAQLLAGIRPSILRRIGYRAAPLDLLDDDGLMGWSIGVNRLLADMTTNPSPTSVAAEMIDWLQGEVSTEAARWRSPDLVLRQLEFILRVWPEAGRAYRFASVWSDNVEAARQRTLTRGLGVVAHDRARLERLLDRAVGVATLEPLAASLERARTDLEVVPDGPSTPARSAGLLLPAPKRRTLTRWLEDVELLGDRVA
ncbi:MAG: hypothetical protein AAFN30_20100 [Actinomycetota bacterium]